MELKEELDFENETLSMQLNFRLQCKSLAAQRNFVLRLNPSVNEICQRFWIRNYRPHM